MSGIFITFQHRLEKNSCSPNIIFKPTGMEQTTQNQQPEKPSSSQTGKQLNPSPHREDLVRHYWGSINYVAGLIKSSEIKAGLILSFYGILFNFIYKNIDSVLVKASDNFFLYILIGLWIIFTVASVFFSIRCFMPRIEGKFEKNMFFFGDVISKFGSIKDFSSSFYEISLNKEELFDQLGQQIFVNSKIAAAKFKNVNRSVILLTLGLILLFIIAICYTILSIE